MTPEHQKIFRDLCARVDVRSILDAAIERVAQLEAENKRLREALEADRPKGIAEKFATLVEKKDGWYRGIIDYKLDDGDVTRVGELKVTLVGE